MCSSDLGDPDPLLYHGEIVRRDGRALGYVRAASYGHTLGGAVGLAMLEADEPITGAFLDGGTWTVEVAGTEHSARVSLRPLFDPAMQRIKC